MTDQLYEFEELLEQIQHTITTDDKEQFREIFLSNHTYDQGQLYLALEDEERPKVYEFLSPTEMAEVFELLEEDVEDVEEYLKEMDDQYAAMMLADMYADNAVDVLQEINEEDTYKYLKLMPKKTALEIGRLFNYEDHTAGAMMTTEFIMISEELTVEQAMKSVKEKGSDAETVYYIYVVDEEQHLSGVITLKDLIFQPDSASIKDIMKDRVLSVQDDADQIDVAQAIRDYDFLALPVVDEAHKLLGIITVDDVIDVMDEEATSDYSGLAGVDVDEQSESNVFEASYKRFIRILPLLAIGLCTSFLLQKYQPFIAEYSVLAIFITLITGVAAHSGTHSLAVAVRRLSNHDETSEYAKIIGKEIGVGLMTAIGVGVLAGGVVGIWQYNWLLGIIIGISVSVATITSTIIGVLVPLIMDKLQIDPSIASGPFISTITDLSSVLIYLTIAHTLISRVLV